jgi:hypothetical protein
MYLHSSREMILKFFGCSPAGPMGTKLGFSEDTEAKRQVGNSTTHDLKKRSTTKTQYIYSGYIVVI